MLQQWLDRLDEVVESATAPESVSIDLLQLQSPGDSSTVRSVTAHPTVLSKIGLLVRLSSSTIGREQCSGSELSRT